MKNKEYDFRKVISLGSDICKRLKKIYYPDIHWHKIVKKEIPGLFGKLKIAGRSHGFAEGKNEIEFLEFLMSCPDEDFRDLLNEG